MVQWKKSHFVSLLNANTNHNEIMFSNKEWDTKKGFRHDLGPPLSTKSSATAAELLQKQFGSNGQSLLNSFTGSF